MADEAYRAVFLRVHPTGKMVLSLTTEPDGNRFGIGHGYNTAPSGGTSAAVVSASEKIRAKAQLLAGVALDAAPETLQWSNGAWAGSDADDPTRVKTIEELALYAHGTGALPPGVEGGLDAQTVYRD